MASYFTKEDLDQQMRKLWADRGFTIAEDERLGVSVAELVDYSAERNGALDAPYVELWIGILDECISWCLSLYVVVQSKSTQQNPLTNFDKSILLVLGKIISDSLAIRHLVLMGFDTSAKTILRSVSEYMEVIVSIIHQPSFADEFIISDTPEAAQTFWKLHLRGGKIRRRVTAAWLDFFRSENNPKAAEWFANWGRGAHPMLSGLSHPSAAGGIFAALPLKVNHTSDDWLGIWGDKSDSSVNTIYVYLHFLFPILLLQRDFPFSDSNISSKQDIEYDEKNEIHRHVKIGRDILASLILSLGKDTNAPFVFPKLDLSLFPDRED